MVTVLNLSIIHKILNSYLGFFFNKWSNKMKKLILLITILAFNIGCSEKTVDNLQQRDGIAYEVNTDNPFTGKLLRKYKDGQKQFESNFNDGKEHGLRTEWRKNGQKKSEINYKDGKRYGLSTWWHKNGQKWSKTNYNYDGQHGLRTEWHKNGQQKSNKCYQNGKKANMSNCR